ncbi:hypothetical protein [Pseudobacteriovorax antillogorgiicola]|uniref:Lipoprotein n=1 Tax=Pseudobacteriovorax antillogorgiicola TaxID=1513793 RepID=A0A1Y6BTK7_9BACT|nr:hypothetical protein [Pseudobacteriovorax antillogorgiicola]TCS54606.1 hypothetical protein EDD56_106119 [Pseudobacteriovorax antillogorgiicola]SMF17593.1 hypothetical protein SAMN06296036_106124 [Pseudobacteriovorax antillogorgiicola]
MKQLFLSTLLFGFVACSQSPSSETKRSSLDSMESSSRVSEDDVAAMFEELDKSQVTDTASQKSAESIEATPEPAIQEPEIESDDFMSDIEAQVFEAFATRTNDEGQTLPPEMAEPLATQFMSVIKAAESRDPAATSAAWNEFISLAEQMKADQQSAALAGGIISDTIDLVMDALALVLDLVDAVLDLDVAGVIDVALDAVDLVIDFLI